LAKRLLHPHTPNAAATRNKELISKEPSTFRKRALYITAQEPPHDKSFDVQKAQYIPRKSRNGGLFGKGIASPRVHFSSLGM